MAVKKRYALAWALGSLTVLATLIANVKEVFQPAVDYGIFKNQFEAIKVAQASQEDRLAAHEAEDREKELKLARELGGIAEALTSINKSLSRIESGQKETIKIVKAELT